MSMLQQEMTSLVLLKMLHIHQQSFLITHIWIPLNLTMSWWEKDQKVIHIVLKTHHWETFQKIFCIGILGVMITWGRPLVIGINITTLSLPLMPSVNPNQAACSTSHWVSTIPSSFLMTMMWSESVMTLMISTSLISPLWRIFRITTASIMWQTWKSRVGLLTSRCVDMTLRVQIPQLWLTHVLYMAETGIDR